MQCILTSHQSRGREHKSAPNCCVRGRRGEVIVVVVPVEVAINQFQGNLFLHIDFFPYQRL